MPELKLCAQKKKQKKSKENKMKKTILFTMLLFCPLIAGLLYLTAQAEVTSEEQLKDQIFINSMIKQQSPVDLLLNSKLQQQLRTKIQNYNPNKLTIYSKKGEVTLQGTFSSWKDADQIEREVLLVSGITRLHNHIKVEIK